MTYFIFFREYHLGKGALLFFGYKNGIIAKTVLSNGGLCNLPLNDAFKKVFGSVENQCNYRSELSLTIFHTL